ncbi:MAG: phosphoribosyltransferase [Armatimonadetes bacterium]|nr:phosphoribosyltransferase [Armatimonadota bacterium]
MVFDDRTDAGRRLAEALMEYRGRRDVVVLGVPRGGGVVAYEVACALGAPLDVVVSRKIPAPGNPELAIGAVAPDGSVVMDPMAERYLAVTDDYVQRAVAEEVAEIHRRMEAYRGDRPPVPLEGKTVIVVDDGIATGATVLATLRGLRAQNPKELVLAIPVGPPASIERLAPEADRVVALQTPEFFYAVGEWYRDFRQVSDEEVINLLERSRECAPAAA